MDCSWLDALSPVRGRIERVDALEEPYAQAVDAIGASNILESTHTRYRQTFVVVSQLLYCCIHLRQ